MAATVEWLAAKEEIREVLLRYCRGVDRCDEELLRGVYHEDSYDDHGSFKGDGREFASAIVASKRTDALFSIHHVGNMSIDIELDADTATAETYFVAANRLRAAPDHLQVFVGRYVDRFDRRDRQWAIAQRLVVHDWSGDVPITGEGVEGLPLDMFARGDRYPDDAVYSL